MQGAKGRIYPIFDDNLCSVSGGNTDRRTGTKFPIRHAKAILSGS